MSRREALLAVVITSNLCMAAALLFVPSRLQLLKSLQAPFHRGMAVQGLHHQHRHATRLWYKYDPSRGARSSAVPKGEKTVPVPVNTSLEDSVLAPMPVPIGMSEASSGGSLHEDGESSLTSEILSPVSHAASTEPSKGPDLSLNSDQDYQTTEDTDGHQSDLLFFAADSVQEDVPETFPAFEMRTPSAGKALQTNRTRSTLSANEVVAEFWNASLIALENNQSIDCLVAAPQEPRFANVEEAPKSNRSLSISEKKDAQKIENRTTSAAAEDDVAAAVDADEGNRAVEDFLGAAAGATVAGSRALLKGLQFTAAATLTATLADEAREEFWDKRVASEIDLQQQKFETEQEQLKADFLESIADLAKRYHQVRQEQLEDAKKAKITLSDTQAKHREQQETLQRQIEQAQKESRKAQETLQAEIDRLLQQIEHMKEDSLEDKQDYQQALVNNTLSHQETLSKELDLQDQAFQRERDQLKATFDQERQQLKQYLNILKEDKLRSELQAIRLDKQVKSLKEDLVQASRGAAFALAQAQQRMQEELSQQRRKFDQERAALLAQQEELKASLQTADIPEKQDVLARWMDLTTTSDDEADAPVGPPGEGSSVSKGERRGAKSQAPQKSMWRRL